MERVMVIGCSGAGKSTLSRKLGEKTGLPVLHLDQIFWSPGNWDHLEREAFDTALEKETQKNCWIIDGNYNRTIPLRLNRCDTVIYLDFSTMRCIFGWIGRVIKNWGTARPDMAPGCAERFDPEMAGFIWNFNRKNRKKYYEMLSAQEEKQIYILKSRREVKKFLEQIGEHDGKRN